LLPSNCHPDLEFACKTTNTAVQRIIDAVGLDSNGVPNSNILVVSDHGFETFHTAMAMNNLLTSQGINLSKVRAVTSGPAVNLYISLQGREPNGTVTRGEYLSLQNQLLRILHEYSDTNPTYTLGKARVPPRCMGLMRRNGKGAATRPRPLTMYG